MSGYQEVITDPSYAGQVVAFTSTHIGNYGTNAEDDEAPGPHCRGVVVRDLAAVPSNWRSTEGLETVPGPPRHPGAHRGRHPAADPPPARRRAPCPVPSGRPPEAELRAAAAAAPGTDGLDLVSGVTTAATATHGSGPAACDRGLRLRGQGDHGAPADRPGHGDRRAGRRPRPPRSSPSSPTASSSPTAPAIRPPWRAHGGHGRPGGPGADLRHLPGPPAPGHRARWPHLQAALRPPRGQSPGAAPGQRRGGDHQPEPQLRRGRRLGARRRGHPRQPQRRRDRRLRCPRAPAFSVQYHPEAAPGPHDARYLFATFGPHARPSDPPAGAGARGGGLAVPRRDDLRVHPGHRLRADRHRPGLRIRLLGHPGLPRPGARRATGSSWPTPTRPPS